MLRVTEAFLDSDPGDAGRRREGRRARAGRVGVKRRGYADTQELYKRCPARLADLVRRNDLRSLLDPGDVVRPPADRIKDAYERLWGGTGQCDLQLEDVAPVNGLCPVSATKVRKRMKKLKPNGLDGIRKKHLFALESSPGLLAGLFNCLLWTGHYPEVWKRNVTSMIPKEGKDQSQPGGWRPITLGSVLARLFSGIMDNRLRSFVRLSPRQLGFVEGNGNFSNVRALHEAIRLGKKRQLCGVVLDVSKAFDCVPHEAIGRCLGARGVPGPLAEIQKMYQHSTTTFRNCGGFEIELKRGVKQGDPLSPMLFNIFLDSLLDALQEMDLGLRVGANTISVLAFADELVLLAHDPIAAQMQLDTVVKHLDRVGMELSVEKCGVFA